MSMTMSMTQLSGAHAFCRFLSQFQTEYLEILHNSTGHSQVMSSPNIGKNFVNFWAELQKLDHLTYIVI